MIMPLRSVSDLYPYSDFSQPPGLPVCHRGVVCLYAEIFTRIAGYLHHFSRDRVRSRGPDATSGGTKGYGSASVIDASWRYVRCV